MTAEELIKTLKEFPKTHEVIFFCGKQIKWHVTDVSIRKNEHDDDEIWLTEE